MDTSVGASEELHKLLAQSVIGDVFMLLGEFSDGQFRESFYMFVDTILDARVWP